MDIQNHLKVAVSEITKAADLLKQEINELRNEESNLRQSIEKNIAQLSIQVSSRQKEAQMHDDPSLKAQSQTFIDSLLRQISDAKSQIKLDQQRIQDAIRDKEALINSLDQQARQIVQ